MPAISSQDHKNLLLDARSRPMENEWELLRNRWVDQLTSRHLITPEDGVFQPLVRTLDGEVQSSMELLALDADDRQFRDLPHASDANLVTTARRFSTMAKAWATPTSRWYSSKVLLDRLREGLLAFNRQTYNDTLAPYGNWWTWEIGVPKELADVMAILKPHLDAQDLAAFSTAIDHHVPDPWLYRRGESQGANRVDLCQAVIIRSVVTHDAARLTHAINGLPPVWQPVSDGDGFYRDGSFIQHFRIAYTGTYGVVLLDGLSKLLSLLAGSSYDLDESKQELLDAVERSFMPFIWRGQMMDCVRGRAISRAHEDARFHGTNAIEAILRLAPAADPDTSARWRRRCLTWVAQAEADGNPGHLTIPQAALIEEAKRSPAGSMPPVKTVNLFPAMDRLVYCAPSWTASLAMSSSRISWYECGNGENELGYQTGSGMTYLYLEDDPHQFGESFWPTMDFRAPAGTTVDSTELPQAVEGQWAASSPQNEWTGMAELGDVALAGQHLIAPGGTGMEARKTWLYTPHGIIALGSDIHTESPAAVKTVVEHRRVKPTVQALSVDGLDVDGEITRECPRWAHLEGVGGYIFLDPQRIRASVVERSGSWDRLNRMTPVERALSASFASLEILHGQDDTYAYMILPGNTAQETEHKADHPPVTVLCNSTEAQAIRVGSLLAITFWKAGSVAGVQSSGPACIILRPDGASFQVSASTPPGHRGTFQLHFSDILGSHRYPSK